MHLNNIAAKGLSPARFTEFAQTIDTAFQSAERELTQARATHEKIKFDQIAHSIREETQRIALSVESYQGAVTSVYGEDEEQRLKQQGNK